MWLTTKAICLHYVAAAVVAAAVDDTSSTVDVNFFRRDFNFFGDYHNLQNENGDDEKNAFERLKVNVTCFKFIPRYKGDYIYQAQLINSN